ncbi:MAG: hypothetical protein II913_04500 [Elusimicrobiaceae bacterium]|nr:hypothetical protein [Elusimicrobiaceae bacterium]
MNIKRLASIFLLVVCLLTQTYVFAFSPAKLERKVIASQNQARQAAAAQQKEQSTQKQTPRTPQQEAKTIYGLPVISWEEFQRESHKQIQKQELINQFFTQLSTLEQVSPQDFHQGEPDYAQITAHAKYIYIGEEHDTPLVQQKVKELIQTIRNNNPNKKILLATEFVVRNYPLQSPLSLAKQPNYLLTDLYYDVLDFAHPLQIDVLALDDIIFHQTRTQDAALLKVGKQYVRVPNQQAVRLANSLDLKEMTANLVPAFQELQENVELLLPFVDDQYIEQYLTQLHGDPQWPELKNELSQIAGPGNEDYLAIAEAYRDSTLPQESLSSYAQNIAVFSTALNTLQASDWGVIQRNQQWAQHIKQVENQYDIVIVWGGVAHFDEFALPSLPMLLDHPDAVSIDFLAIDEDASLEDFSVYSKRLEILNQQGLNAPVCELSSSYYERADRACQIDTTRTFFTTDGYGDLEHLLFTYPQRAKPLLEKLYQSPDIKRLLFAKYMESSYSVYLK